LNTTFNETVGGKTLTGTWNTVNQAVSKLRLVSTANNKKIISHQSATWSKSESIPGPVSVILTTISLVFGTAVTLTVRSSVNLIALLRRFEIT
jgi:hypothetical protein